MKNGWGNQATATARVFYTAAWKEDDQTEAGNESKTDEMDGEASKANSEDTVTLADSNSEEKLM